MKYFESINSNSTINIDDSKQHWELYCILKPKGYRETNNSNLPLVRDTGGYMDVFPRGGTATLSFLLPESMKSLHFMCFVKCDGMRFFGNYSSPLILKGQDNPNNMLLTLSVSARNQNIQSMTNSLRVYVFTNKQLKKTGNTGIQVFNEKGEKIFDSNKKYAQIIDYIEKDYMQGSGYYEPPKRYNNVKNIAIAPMTLARTEGGAYRIQSVTTNGNQLEFYDYNRGSSNGNANGPEYINQTRILVASIDNLENEPVYDYIPELS